MDNINSKILGISIIFLVIISMIYMFFYNSVKWIRNRWTQRILILLWIVLIIYVFIYQVVYVNIKNRATICMLPYNNYKVAMGSFPTTYYNQYYGKNMDLNIADYYWMASRKSYLACGESYDVTNINAINNNISAGARCLELDIYPSNDSLIETNVLPYVRSQNMLPGNIAGNSNGLLLNDCLQVIANNAWKVRSDYPIILLLNIGGNSSGVFNNNYLTNIAKGIMSTFGANGRLLDKKYGYAGRNNTFPFGKIPIGDIMGRIGIVTNMYPYGVDMLNELINSAINKGIQMIKYTDANINYGGLASTYSDKNALIEFNYENVTMVQPQSNFSVINIIEPKQDLVNIDFKDAWSFGCQIVWMNFQLNNAQINAYLDAFKDASLLVKPNNLRYIPRPLPPVQKQQIVNYYAPRVIQQSGWYTQNV